MLDLAKRWLPPPAVLHPFPDARFAATYPRQEPDALTSARPDLCGGYRASGIPTAIDNHCASGLHYASEELMNPRQLLVWDVCLLLCVISIRNYATAYRSKNLECQRSKWRVQCATKHLLSIARRADRPCVVIEGSLAASN
jgi:hypothetical protein